MSGDELDTLHAPPPAAGPPRLRPIDVAIAVAMCGTSGAALLAETFLDVPLTLTAPFIVLPTAIVAIAVVFVRTGRADRFALIGDRVLAGGLWGLGATGVYDVGRPLLLKALQLDFNPYRAMPVFGHLATGRPKDDGVAVAVGWIYHFWNGITFGMMYALVRPEGGWVTGLIWGLGLQLLMMWAYPDLLGVRLEDPGFLASTIIGHSAWGAVLGAGIAHWHRSATSPRGGAAHA